MVKTGCRTQHKYPAKPHLTPVAGLIFETKIESFFLESFFLFSGELFSGAALLPENFVPINVVEWILFPRIRTFVQKRFHGLFSKKKRSKYGVFLRFQKENTFGQ